MDFNYERTGRLIVDAVEAVDLDLGGLKVYTEAATGGFAVTAGIAVAAGAETVHAIAHDSSYGSESEAREHTERVVDSVGDVGRLSFPVERRPGDFEGTDIVTNTGFVRPIDEEVAEWLGPNAAVSLMFEPWEFRAADMDIEALWARGIPVLGTNESDDRVATQRYLRVLATVLAQECDLEILRGDFVVVGGGRMARHAAAGLRSLGGSVVRIDPSACDRGDGDVIPEKVIEHLDGLFVVDHETDELLVGREGIIDPGRLVERTSGVTVVHICGPVAWDDLDELGLRYVPEDPAHVGTMSYTTGYLGPRPIVDLHAAGLRVGAELVRERRSGADHRTATRRVARTPLALDFDEEFKRSHGFYE